MSNYYYEYPSEEEEEQTEILANQKRKRKNQVLFLTLLILGGAGYYFFIYLNQKKQEAKAEIKQILQNNSLVSISNLDTKLWKEKSSWETHLNSLSLLTQINNFKEKMKREIVYKNQELTDLPRKRKEEEIRACKNFLEEEEKSLPEIKQTFEELITKINNSPLDDLSTPSQEFVNLVQEKRDKRKRLYWKLPAHNWADRWLKRNRKSFEAVWEKMKKMNDGKEPNYFDAKAIYKINFPPSLWNQLTEEQKQKAKDNGHDELKLKPDVQSYKFSPLITEWEERAKRNPVRGIYDPNNPSVLDNNALFYGAPRTGKSVMAEKLAYQSNKYPLVTIQGSTLTPTKVNEDSSVTLLLKFFFTICSITYDLVDDYGFSRTEDGEARYILFLDEADQIATTNLLPPDRVSAKLTFLKECMGSDSKDEESKNLWIAATNHLDSINIAIYQSGRLSNPLCFSWTLGDFKKYANSAGITHQFPKHWIETNTLNEEDNKQVNKFNTIIFNGKFLPFWRKFINNADTQKELKEIKEWKTNPITNEREEVIKQKGIQLGEFLEFFWQLYDSKQLENSNGKWEKPKKPNLEEVLEANLKLTANKIGGDIAKVIETRLNELNNTAKETKNILNTGSANLNNAISSGINSINVLLSQMKR
jgi:hypothetical protein